MSVKNKKASHLSDFGTLSPSTRPATTATLELNAMLIIYDRLIMLLRDTHEEGLDAMTDGLISQVVRCRAALAHGMEQQAGQQMVNEMREELRLIPRTLRFLLPGIGPRLCESMEYQLGVQFSRF